MNKTVFITALIIIGSACSNAPEGDTATIKEGQETAESHGVMYEADTAASEITFTGFGVGKQHPGTFHLASGSVTVDDNLISGGEFTIDIRTMEVEKGDVFKNELRPHLMSGDFFDVEKFGTSRFVITKVEPYRAGKGDSSVVDGANVSISGNLTLKDVTKNITFPAKVDLDNNTLKGKADFNIDRTQWQMNYGNNKTLGDKFISPTVNVKLDLKARRREAVM